MSTPSARPAFLGMAFRAPDRSVTEFGESGLRDALAAPDTFVWVDVEAPDAAALDPALAALGLDRTAFSHLVEAGILPRMTETAHALSFHLYETEDPERHLDTAQGISEIEVDRMLLVLGRNFVLTWHKVPFDAVDDVRRTAADAFRLAGRTPGFVAFLFLERCLYDYAHLNLANDNYLDQLEPCVRRGDRAALLDDIRIAALNILTLKKLAASLHIVLMRLATKRSPFVSEDGRQSFQTMLDNAAAVRSAIDSSRELLDGVLGSLQAEAASRTSHVAAVLTVLSAIMLPLTLVAGVYGMNFSALPLADHPHGFWILCAAMGVAGAAMFAWFRRLGWIGRK